MRRLSRHIGATVFSAITVALLVVVGVDAIAAIIDEAGAVLGVCSRSKEIRVVPPPYRQNEP